METDTKFPAWVSWMPTAPPVPQISPNLTSPQIPIGVHQIVPNPTKSLNYHHNPSLSPGLLYIPGDLLTLPRSPPNPTSTPVGPPKLSNSTPNSTPSPEGPLDQSQFTTKGPIPLQWCVTTFTSDVMGQNNKSAGITFRTALRK